MKGSLPNHSGIILAKYDLLPVSRNRQHVLNRTATRLPQHPTVIYAQIEEAETRPIKNAKVLPNLALSCGDAVVPIHKLPPIRHNSSPKQKGGHSSFQKQKGGHSSFQKKTIRGTLLLPSFAAPSPNPLLAHPALAIMYAINAIAISAVMTETPMVVRSAVASVPFKIASLTAR